MAQLSRKKFNLEVQSLRSFVVRARVQLCRKLINYIHKFSKKCANDNNKNEKNLRKVSRLKDEVHILRNLKPKSMSIFALKHSVQSCQLLREKDGVESRTRALAKLSLHKLIKPVVEEFHKKYPNWEQELYNLENGVKMNSEQNVNDSGNTSGKEENESSDSDEEEESSVEEMSNSDSGNDNDNNKTVEKDIETGGRFVLKKANNKHSSLPSPLNSKSRITMKDKMLSNTKSKPKFHVEESDVSFTEEEILPPRITPKKKSSLNKWLVEPVKFPVDNSEVKEIEQNEEKNSSDEDDDNNENDESNLITSEEENSDSKLSGESNNTNTIKEEDKQLIDTYNSEKKEKKLSSLSTENSSDDDDEDDDNIENDDESNLSTSEEENSDVKLNEESKSISIIKEEHKQLIENNNSVKKEIKMSFISADKGRTDEKNSEKHESICEESVERKLEIPQTKLADESQNTKPIISKQVLNEDPFFLTKDNQKYMTYGKIVEEPKELPLKESKKLDFEPKKFQKSWNDKSFFNKTRDNGNKTWKDQRPGKRKLLPTENVVLHPSWEAKRKVSTILPFQGKKITFD